MISGRDTCEADITGACDALEANKVTGKGNRRFANELKRLFILQNRQTGPVLIDIPADIQQNEIEKFEYPRNRVIIAA